MMRILAGLALSAMLAACGEEQKPYKPPMPQSGAGNSTAPQLFHEQREALDKAKETGQILEQAAKSREEAAEKAAR